MTAIGWTALGALSTKVVAVSSALPEMLGYTIATIAVCATVYAFVSLAEANRRQEDGPADSGSPENEASMIRVLADQTQFTETRVRLLKLAQRLESHRYRRMRDSLSPPPRQAGGA